MIVKLSNKILRYLKRLRQFDVPKLFCVGSV
jgi:hypothetical protein